MIRNEIGFSEGVPQASVGRLPVSREDPVRVVLGSAAVGALRAALARVGASVEERPILFKALSDSLFRVIFPVTGTPVDRGTVVSIVCLYDRHRRTTLYAHPMHAGPEVNPLLKHLDGPMAFPKAQPGEDGDRATHRIMAHKEALWDRFLKERGRLGEEEAGRRWREGYYWSLRRLYFCTRCPQCKWGSPFFDGLGAVSPWDSGGRESPRPGLPPGHRFEAIVAEVLQSRAWQVEVDYARRGGFSVTTSPRLLHRLEGGFVLLVFPTNARWIQGGVLVGVAVMHHEPSRRVVFAHCLSAGPEAEIVFLRGDTALALPPPQPGDAAGRARLAYTQWRVSAWHRFWLDDLEQGVARASENWLRAFWTALERLFGGNELHDLDESFR